MYHIGTEIFKKQAAGISFLSNKDSNMHYLYKDKKLHSIIYFEQNNSINDYTKKVRIPYQIIEKAKKICKKKSIMGYYAFINMKLRIFYRIKFSNNQGEMTCSHKISNRDGVPVNYLIDLAGQPEIIKRSFS